MSPLSVNNFLGTYGSPITAIDSVLVVGSIIYGMIVFFRTVFDYYKRLK